MLPLLREAPVARIVNASSSGGGSGMLKSDLANRHVCEVRRSDRHLLERRRPSRGDRRGSGPSTDSTKPPVWILGLVQIGWGTKWGTEAHVDQPSPAELDFAKHA
jgi:hypothetical protein